MWLNKNDIFKTLCEEHFTIELERRIFNLPVYDGSELSVAELGTVNAQYRKYMSRRSTYVCDSFVNHLRNHSSFVELSGSYVVGTRRRSSSSALIVSHFAPKSLRGGMNLLKSVKESNTVLVLAVTDNLTNMLDKLDYVYLFDAPQMFNGELVTKKVYCSNRRAVELFRRLQNRKD